MLKEFKEFISKGNVIDLAVAVVIGAAFAVIVKSFTDDILGQVLAAIGGKPDFTSLTLTLRNVTVKGVETPVELRYGAFITDGLNRDFPTPLVLGSVLSLMLAVAADAMFSVLQRYLAPWNRVDRGRSASPGLTGELADGAVAANSGTDQSRA